MNSQPLQTIWGAQGFGLDEDELRDLQSTGITPKCCSASCLQAFGGTPVRSPSVACSSYEDKLYCQHYEKLFKKQKFVSAMVLLCKVVP